VKGSTAVVNRDDPVTPLTTAAAAAAAAAAASARKAAPATPLALLGLGPRVSATGFFDPRGVGVPAEIGGEGGREGGKGG